MLSESPSIVEESRQPDLAASRFAQYAIDIGERIFVVLLGIPFVTAFTKALPTHPTLLIICASEMFSVIFILIRKPGPLRLSAIAVSAAFLGTAFSLLARPGGVPLVPTLVSSVLMFLGFVLSVASKLFLNRSFGLIAANRGVKTSGPYRLVRHPMYLGYILAQFGFLLSSISVRNVCVYLAVWAFQIVRIREEEAVLGTDPTYREFSKRVADRLIPKLY
jgi:protein-S-isoprenylcysteine O-methyltransferase Ste14